MAAAAALAVTFCSLNCTEQRRGELSINRIGFDSTLMVSLIRSPDTISDKNVRALLSANGQLPDWKCRAAENSSADAQHAIKIENLSKYEQRQS
jgi:hypothetical protein